MNSHIDIAQKAEARKEEIETERNLPEDIIQEVKQAGLVKRWATKSVGGEESSVFDVCRMIRDISYYNGSLAWVIAVTGCSSLFSGFIEDEKADILFNGNHCMVGGFAGPAGLAKATEDGGLQVSGHWTWGSGITHCSHIVGGVRIMNGEDFVKTAVVFFDPEEVEFIDNWHVLGLKGSYSIDYMADQVLIPSDRWSAFPVQKAIVDAPLYRFSFLGALSMSVASVGLGLANRALSEIKTLAQTKSPFGQGKALTKKPEAQQQIGQIEANYHAAVALFEKTIQDAEEEVENGECSIETKAKIRLASAHSASLSHTVVQAAFNLAGGSAVWKTSKLEELLRDMNVVKQHGMVNTMNYRTVGAVALGENVPMVML